MRRKENDYLGDAIRAIGTTLNVAVGIIKFGAWMGSAFRSSPEYKAPRLEDTSPMEGMAHGAELEQYKRSSHRSFYLGNIHPDHGLNFPCGIDDDRHILLKSGTRSGKGRSIIIQNALRWRGGLIGLDPKGEIASITAMRRGSQEKALGTGTSVRKFIGQRVAVLDPFNQVIGPARSYKIDYNPLSDIDISDLNSQSQIEEIASACIVPEEGKNSHFSDNAQTIMAGVIEAILYTLPKEDQTLPKVREYLLMPFDELLFILEDIDPDAMIAKGEKPKSRGRIPKGRLASEAGSVIVKLLDTDEAGSFNSTLSRNLKWLSEPQIEKHLSSNSASVEEIIQEGGTVYIVVPPTKVERYRSWIRILFQIAMNAKEALGTEQQTIPTLFVLDEFPLLGRSKEIEAGSAVLAGYNVKFFIVAQSTTQLKTLYKENWETFAGNSGAIICFGTNDSETEEYLSKRMGKILAWETSYSVNTGASAQAMGAGGTSDGTATSQAKRERAIRLPNEIHEQGAREQMRAFVIPASGKPFVVQRQNYDDIPASGLYDSPGFLIQWEAKYGRRLK